MYFFLYYCLTHASHAITTDGTTASPVTFSDQAHAQIEHFATVSKTRD